MIDNLIMGFDKQVQDLKETHAKESKELRDEIRSLKMGYEETDQQIEMYK